MKEIERILGAMDQINRQMRVVIHKSGSDRNQQIVALRQQFSAETGNLISKLPTDERLRYNPDLFHELQDRLSLVRRKLASHQAKWTLQDITTRRDDYLHATESVHGSIADYLDWAKSELASA